MEENRKHHLESVADALREARQTGRPLAAVDPELGPNDLAEAYYVQDTVAKSFGPVGGWKIGSATPDGEPFFAPMPTAWFAKDDDVLSDSRHRLRGVECEIAFQIGKDLPPRATPYTREEVLAAVESAHPAIEVLEAGLQDPKAVPRFHMMGDLQMHGGFVPGPAFASWREQDWANETVQLIINGDVAMERTASNPAGTDLIRLLVYLANEGSSRTGGLKVGQWITSGSWTGATWVKAGDSVCAAFRTAGKACLRFA